MLSFEQTQCQSRGGEKFGIVATAFARSTKGAEFRISEHRADDAAERFRKAGVLPAAVFGNGAGALFAPPRFKFTVPDSEKRLAVMQHLDRALQHLDSLQRIKSRLHHLSAPPSEEGQTLRRLNEDLIALTKAEIERYRAELEELPR